jgi:hypothetical protein
LIQQYIGSGSKLAFLNTKGEINIINDKAGVWDDGVWYSNSGYKATSYFDYGGTKVSTINNYQAKPTTYTQNQLAFPSKPKETKVDDAINHDCIDCNDAFIYDEKDWYGNPKKAIKCDYCGESCNTSGERLNGCCTHCFDIMNDESINDWLGYRRSK